MLIVLVLPGILFPPKRSDRRTVGRSASSATPRAPTVERSDSGATPRAAAESAAAATRPSVCPTVPRSDVPAETVWVSSPRARFGLSTAGARLLSAELLDYKSFAPGDAERPVQLVPADRPLLAHCLVVGGDTISLADWRFTASVPAQIGRASCREREEG